ncbi:MAG: vWA domain-containing protein [Planctomycetales bacterium]
MNSRTIYFPCGVALAFHVALLVAFFFITVAAGLVDNPFVVETIIPDEERLQEEFVKELDTQETPADTINFVAGSISTNFGGSNSPLANMRPIEITETTQDPDFTFQPAVDVTVGPSELVTDLGEAEVTGEVGALVEGYGDALDRITQELLRMMRKDKLLVVWLFDESESMVDDQQEIKTRIGRVYTELKLADAEPAGDAEANARRPVRKEADALLTVVTSFGEKYHIKYESAQKPTNDVAVLMQDIDKIPVDKTGVENTCQTLSAAIQMFGGIANRDRRKLVLIVVSDESGDDGDGPLLEQTLHAAKTRKAPIYFLGREAAFGSYYAHVEWRHPVSAQMHYLPIRRGPETPFPELLQHNGFGKRLDSQMSGFGPYTQVRLARDTGGVFFQLPHEQSNLHDFEAYKYEMLDLREYLPNLESRQQYEAEVNGSPFRRAIWDGILALNPYKYDGNYRLVDNPEVTVPIDGWYVIAEANRPGGDPDVKADLQKIMKVLDLMTRAQKRLEDVKHLRAGEASLRWRANYDLMYAQLFAYRVRLFEYGIGLAQFQKNMGKLLLSVSDKRVNRWRVVHGVPSLIIPDAEQTAFLKVTPEDLKEAHQRALEQFAYVQQEHPKTAFAKRAEWEVNRNFGVRFEARYFPPPPPPNPNAKPQPQSKPVPIPNL